MSQSDHHLPIHPTNLLNVYFVPDTAQGSEDPAISKTGMVISLMKMIVLRCKNAGIYNTV